MQLRHDNIVKLSVPHIEMLHCRPSRAVLLEDAAVYQRTPLGQRKLLNSTDWTHSPQLRFLARVNGFTNLRTLVELEPDSTNGIAGAILELVEDGFIELVGQPEAGVTK